MKIVSNPEKLAPSGNARVASTGSNESARTGKPQAVESSAQVELSSSASGLQGRVSAAGEGDFDAQKVERISQAIASGNFKVNAEAIADKLITNAQEVLGKFSR